MVKIDGLVDKETGEAILAAFDAAMTPTNRDESTPPDDTEGPSSDVRSAPQRRAEALAQICRHYLDNFPGVVGGRRPHVSLIVDLDTLLGRTGKRCDLSHTAPSPPTRPAASCATPSVEGHRRRRFGAVGDGTGGAYRHPCPTSGVGDTGRGLHLGRL